MQKDHNPPHFYVKYGDYNAIFIIDKQVIKGEMPSRIVKLVAEWAELHQDELMQNWQRLLQGEEAEKIEPLIF